MKLTALERDILNHRLELPEAICETLEIEDTYTKITVHEICNHIMCDHLDYALEEDRGLTYDILCDCVECSTYYGATKSWSQLDEGELNKLLKKIKRAGYYLAKKITQLTGRPLEFPLY